MEMYRVASIIQYTEGTTIEMVRTCFKIAGALNNTKDYRGGRIDEVRKRGKPRRRWIEAVKEDLGKIIRKRKCKFRNRNN